MLRPLSYVMVVYSYFLIYTNLSTLPRRIPTHFAAAGEPNGWESPDTLWILLAVQILTTVVFLGVPYLGQRFPQTVSLGWRKLSDYPPAQQERILPLLHDMMGFLSLLTNLFLTFILYRLIQAARQPHPSVPMGWSLPLLLVGVAFIVIYYLWKINHAAKEEGAS